jgi:hypothetical protein
MLQLLLYNYSFILYDLINEYKKNGENYIYYYCNQTIKIIIKQARHAGDMGEIINVYKILKRQICKRLFERPKLR